MGDPVTLAALFGERPWQWGLRGDPHLWNAMEAELRDVEAPADPERARAMIEAAFERLSGRPLGHPEPFHVPRLDHGGMSGGHVQPLWWRETGLPLLLNAHARLVRGEPAPAALRPPWHKPAPPQGSGGTGTA